MGVAAAVYVSRKKPGTAAWAAGALSTACSALSKKTMAMMMNGNWKAQAMSSAPKPTDGTAAKSEGDWEQIEALINSDPAVKKQTDRILAESSATTH